MSDLKIVYDGDCPFCSAYTRVTRLRAAVGDVEIIDARSDHPFVRDVKAMGYDLNEGMLAKYQDQLYFGADCMHLLALLSNRSGVLNKTIAVVMKQRQVARFLYPALRFGRNTTLRLMGRQRIT